MLVDKKCLTEKKIRVTMETAPKHTLREQQEI